MKEKYQKRSGFVIGDARQEEPEQEGMGWRGSVQNGDEAIARARARQVERVRCCFHFGKQRASLVLIPTCLNLFIKSRPGMPRVRPRYNPG